MRGVHVGHDGFDTRVLLCPMCVHVCGGAASEVRAILDDEAANVSPASAEFWIMVAALKAFVVRRRRRRRRRGGDAEGPYRSTCAAQ